jgi:amidase
VSSGARFGAGILEKGGRRQYAVITPMYELARQRARDTSLEGPLAGVPCLLKDLIATYAGVRHTEGCRFLKDYVSPVDSELVWRMKKAGLVILGKTNTPEFGNAATVEPELFGACHNPWRLDRTTGGSSGGSAAAVAAGLVPIAHGNDGGGSIRNPASCCGVFGMKPTRGRNPLGPAFGDFFSGLESEHVLTRSVRDSALMLDALSGPASGDPYQIPLPSVPFLQEVGKKPQKLNIAFYDKVPSGAPVHTECKKAVTEVARLCAELGHEVEMDFPKYDQELFDKTFTDLWSDGNAWLVNLWAARLGRAAMPDQFEPFTWALYQIGIRRTAADHLRAVQDMHAISRQAAIFFDKYDMLLTPTLSKPPVPLGFFKVPANDPMKVFDKIGDFEAFLAIANATGQPAMSIPLCWSDEEGLPIGVQFIGRFGCEGTMFRLASQLEEARPWSKRRPKL